VDERLALELSSLFSYGQHSLFCTVRHTTIVPQKPSAPSPTVSAVNSIFYRIDVGLRGLPAHPRPVIDVRAQRRILERTARAKRRLAGRPDALADLRPRGAPARLVDLLRHHVGEPIEAAL